MKNKYYLVKVFQFTNINGDINKKEYKAIYDGRKAKMLLKDNNKKYYIEADNNDIKDMLNQKPSKDKLDDKLLMLLDRKKEKKKEKVKKKNEHLLKDYQKKHYKKKNTLKKKNKEKKNTLKKKDYTKFITR